MNKKNKNEVYNNYLENNVSEAELIDSLNSLQEKNIKNNGIIYTPWNVVQEMIRIASPTEDDMIIEPSCGLGIFLFGLLDYMNKKYELKDENLLSWFKEKVVGVEIDREIVKEVRVLLSMYFKKHYNIEVDAKHFSNIRYEDSLQFDTEKNKFDICIGNPPYIRAKHLSKEYLAFLKSNFVSCKKGTIDIYFAFIEKYQKAVKKVVLITPNSFLKSNAGQVLKNLIKDSMTLLIDFKEKKVFKDASVYTCIFKLENNISTTKSEKEKNQIVYGNDLNKKMIIEKQDVFANTEIKNGLVKNILSGIATLSDSIYNVKKDKVSGKYYAKFEGVNYEIEKEILAPYLKITKIKSQKDLDSINYMIYPYGKDKKIIKEENLKADYPLTYNFLLAAKKKLMQRDKGNVDRYESWYAYGRKQGLHTVTEKSIIAIPLMIGGECKPIRLNIEKINEEFGRFVFTSGYVVPEERKTKYKKLLGKDFLDFAKKNGKAWPGKSESYYTLSSKQIKVFK